MPILDNPKHEAFARGLFEGKTQEQAYIDAGYSPKDARSAASRLMSTNVSISERLKEFEAKAETSAVWTKAEAMNSLAKLHTKFARNDDPASGSVARASVMDYAKLAGWVVDKGEGKMDLNMTVQVSYNGARPEGSAADYETP